MVTIIMEETCRTYKYEIILKYLYYRIKRLIKLITFKNECQYVYYHIDIIIYKVNKRFSKT